MNHHINPVYNHTWYIVPWKSQRLHFHQSYSVITTEIILQCFKVPHSCTYRCPDARERVTQLTITSNKMHILDTTAGGVHWQKDGTLALYQTIISLTEYWRNAVANRNGWYLRQQSRKWTDTIPSILSQQNTTGRAEYIAESSRALHTQLRADTRQITIGQQ